MKIHPVVFLKKISVATLALLKPLGIWGLGALALIDSAFFPMPVSMDGVLIGYVASNPKLFFPYCLIAAVASAIGSLVPYYVGRAGGELFLLKRIDRQRYERMRDRFENQEFLVVMLVAMAPPPFPIKLFEFAAGVFEMKPLPYMLAIFCGKFVQFLVCALITVFYGPTIVHSLMQAVRQHLWLTIALVILIVVALGMYVMRRLFDRSKGTKFPVEEIADEDEGTA